MMEFIFLETRECDILVVPLLPQYLCLGENPSIFIANYIFRNKYTIVHNIIIEAKN